MCRVGIEPTSAIVEIAARPIIPTTLPCSDIVQQSIMNNRSTHKNYVLTYIDVTTSKTQLNPHHSSANFL